MSHLSALRKVADELAREALAPCCDEFGMVGAPLGAWGSREARRIPLSATKTITLVHDEREAPMAAEDPGLLVSLTDEEDQALLAWARPRHESRLLGIGVDLASTKDFAGERGERFNRLLFSRHEQEFVRANYGADAVAGFAFAFAAKEAAFKSLAAPLRTWHEAHKTEELVFEVREFELVDAGHERGTLRHARAQAAMDAMGVGTIALHHRTFGDMAITLALSFCQGVPCGKGRPAQAGSE